MIPHPFDYPPYTADDVDDETIDDVSDFLAVAVDNYCPDEVDRAYNQLWQLLTMEVAA
jgi:hypothetical protein